MKKDTEVPHSMVNLRKPRAGGGGITAIRVGGAGAGFVGGGGGGGAVGGVNGSVQYNLNGGPGGDANIIWDYTNQDLGIIGKTGQAGITVRNGYIASDGGFDATQSGWNAFQGAPTGAGAFLAGVAVAPSGVAGATNGGYIDLADLGYGNYPAPLDGAAFAQPQVLLWNSGVNGTQPGDVNTTTGLMTNAFVNAAAGFVTEAPEWNAIQAPMGGVFGQSLTALNYIHIGTMPADPVPGPGGTMTYGDNLTPGTMYWNTTTNQAMIFNGTQFVPLGGGGNPGGIQGSVQYNNGGTFGGDANFLWNPISQELGIIAITGQAGITVLNGYTESAGFVSTINSWQAIDSVSAGVAGGALTAGYGLTPFQGMGGYIDIAPLVNEGYPVPLPGLAAFGINDVLLWAAGQNSTPTLNNLYGLQCSSWIDAAEGFATAFPAYNAIQATAGGVYALSLHALNYIDPGQSWGPPPLTPGTTAFRAGCISYDTSRNMLTYFNGTAWVPLGAGGVSGAFGSVQYNQNGSLAGDTNFQWAPSAQELYVNGVPGQAAITVSNGYISSAGGLTTAAATYNAIQATSGGVYGLSLHALNYIDPGESWGVPPLTPGTSYFRPGSMYFDLGVGSLMMWDGSQWIAMGAGLSGLQVPCVTFATSDKTLGTSPNMFWESSTQALGVSAIGVNGLSGNSQVRISTGRNDWGMYLTSGSSGQANMAGGTSWVGGWLAHDPNPTIIDMNGGVIRFFCDAGVGGYYSPTQRMTLDYGGNLSVQSGVYSHDFVVNAPGGRYWGVNNAGVGRPILSLSTDNNVYLDNVSDNDIYIRPAAGRYVFMGVGSGVQEWICPNGNNLATLGHPWYRWNNIYTYGLDLAGSFTCSQLAVSASIGQGDAITAGLVGAGWSQLRVVGGAYGVMLRNDGADFYLLVTNPGDPYGIWNGLRPFSFNLASGNVGMSGTVSIGGNVIIGNTSGYHVNDTGGNPRRLLTLWNDNNIYMDGPVDFYFRPGWTRYIFMGAGGMEYVCPNGNNTAMLGHPSYRWNNIYTYNLDVAGSVSGVTRTVNGLWGDVGIAAGSGVSIYNSGNSVVINATGGSNPFNQTLNTWDGPTFYAVTTSGVVQAGSASGVTFQNTNYTFRVDSSGLVACQQVQTNGINVGGWGGWGWGTALNVSVPGGTQTIYVTSGVIIGVSGVF